MPSRVIGVKLSEDQIALLNTKLAGLGYSTMSDFTHAWIEGRITSKQLISDIADSLIEKVQLKLTSACTESVGQGRFELPTLVAESKYDLSTHRVRVLS